LMLARTMTGHVPVASCQPGQICRYRTELLERTRPNFLHITKKNFRVPIKILNTKIKYWSLPLLLVVVVVVVVVVVLKNVIINAWYNYYISNKFLLE
jgi:hypothetical protein